MTVATAAPTTTAGRRLGLVGGLVVAVVVLAVIAFLSLALGSRAVTLQTVWDALTGVTGSADLTVIRDVRVPRTLLGLLVGAALALGGALLQGVARNPLADPGPTSSPLPAPSPSATTAVAGRAGAPSSCSPSPPSPPRSSCSR